ncbi:aspartate aminotransferase [Colletotrichum plurivorum]|uniref:Aspartate aminotransferase n=1 Tax=Colletotrichum plurivorum TaxID=2175906 RepID=A0A8H6KE89_9PEZI|nr:aspartate aminotransferase [Colletotrichum plurivorum]
MGSVALHSHFSGLPEAPIDEAYLVRLALEADESPDKVNLGIGVYRDDDGQAWTLPSVKKVRQLTICPRHKNNHDYPPSGGIPAFVEASRKLLLGEIYDSVASRTASVQTIAGSGALHIGAAFLSSTVAPGAVWISDPSWINHPQIWARSAPGTKRRTYPYFHEETKSFDFAGMISTLERGAKAGDVIILQACAHNPTGCDPTREQWVEIADLCERIGLFPFFDIAYQGFSSGDEESDAWAVRHFASRGTMEICVAQSFSKSFGLYGQRVGAFHLLAHDAAVIPTVRTNLVSLIRSEYASPPAWAARIVGIILGDPELADEWRRDLRTMNARIRSMRAALVEELDRLGTPGSWRHIVEQVGMFSYTGLSASQALRLREEHHIYLFSTGRVSIAGCQYFVLFLHITSFVVANEVLVNSKNVARVAQAIDQVVREDDSKRAQSTDA